MMVCSTHKKAKCGHCVQCGGCKKCEPLQGCKGGNRIGIRNAKKIVVAAPNDTRQRWEGERASKKRAKENITIQASGASAIDITIENQELREEVVSDYDDLTVSSLLRLFKIPSYRVHKVNSAILLNIKCKRSEWITIMLQVVQIADCSDMRI